VARLRLASLQTGEKAYDEALKTLSASFPAAMVPLAADRRGDVLLLQGSEPPPSSARPTRAWAPTRRLPAPGGHQAQRAGHRPRGQGCRGGPPREPAVTTPSLRSLAGALALLAAAVLAGCASGSPRPKPAELPPNVDLIGVRQAWHATLAPIAFPLQVHTLGSQVLLASGDGTVVTLDAATAPSWAAPRRRAPERRWAATAAWPPSSRAPTRWRWRVGALWRHRRPRSYTAPLVAGGRVFVLGADRSLTALDGGNGAKLWSLQRPAEPLVLRQAGVLLPVGNTLVAGLAGRLVGSTPTTAACLGGAHRLGARHQRRRAPGRPGGRRRPRGPVICARAFQTAVGCVDTTRAACAGASGQRRHRPGQRRQEPVRRRGRRHGDGLERRHRRARLATERLKWRELTGPLVLGRSVVLGDGTGLVHLLAPGRQRAGPPDDRWLGHCRHAGGRGQHPGGRNRAGGVYAYRPD
jgi:hypothetical protein